MSNSAAWVRGARVPNSLVGMLHEQSCILITGSACNRSATVWPATPPISSRLTPVHHCVSVSVDTHPPRTHGTCVSNSATLLAEIAKDWDFFSSKKILQWLKLLFDFIYLALTFVLLIDGCRTLLDSFFSINEMFHHIIKRNFFLSDYRVLLCFYYSQVYWTEARFYHLKTIISNAENKFENLRSYSTLINFFGEYKPI